MCPIISCLHRLKTKTGYWQCTYDINPRCYQFYIPIYFILLTRVTLTYYFYYIPKNVNTGQCGEIHDRRKAGKCTDAPDDGLVDWNMLRNLKKYQQTINIVLDGSLFVFVTFSCLFYNRVLGPLVQKDPHNLMVKKWQHTVWFYITVWVSGSTIFQPETTK
jgi:hypothetical protein